eukprot:1346748-Prymnesium_polylepis.1
MPPAAAGEARPAAPQRPREGADARGRVPPADAERRGVAVGARDGRAHARRARRLPGAQRPSRRPAKLL